MYGRNFWLSFGTSAPNSHRLGATPHPAQKWAPDRIVLECHAGGEPNCSSEMANGLMIVQKYRKA